MKAFIAGLATVLSLSILTSSIAAASEYIDKAMGAGAYIHPNGPVVVIEKPKRLHR